MNNCHRHQFFYTTTIIFITILFLFAGCDSNTEDQAELRYKEVKVERGTFKVTVSASGVVQPIDRIEIKSKASGEIVELPIEEGDFILKGELIARLDQKDEKAAVAQAKADFDVAKAELAQANRTFDRRNLLYKDNLISEEEKDQIELDLAVAKGKLIQAETALERAEERLSESVVRAPIDGIILQKYVEKGQIIASGVSNVGGGTPIVDIANMSSVFIEAGIDEIDIGKVEIGQIVDVVADAFPGNKFIGKIVRISPEAKIEQNVTLFDVIVKVENTEGKLKSGMNTNIEITIIDKKNILLIPTIALQQQLDKDQEQRKPYVLLKNGSAFEKTFIKTGLSDFKSIEILEGLKEDDILGVPMTSRLKEDNDRREERIKSSRSFGTSS